MSPQRELERALQLAPAFVAPPWCQRLYRARWLLLISALFGLALWDIDIDWSRLLYWSDVTGNLLLGFLRPTPGSELSVIGAALIETVAMAVAGTFLAIAIAVPLGFLGAKTLISGFLAHAAIRFTFDVLRAIPALVWTIIMIRAVGLGPAAGVIALALAEAPYLAKLFAELIENADRRPVVALRSVGAGPIQALRFGLVSQVLPSFLGLSLYIFEVNVRAAAALGLVGAGGIGELIEERMGVAAYDELSFLIVVLLVLVAFVDEFSSRLRKSILVADPDRRPGSKR